MEVATGLTTADLDRLTPRDKAELDDALEKENHRSEIYSESHRLAEKCWKKCALSVKNQLDKKEQTCLQNCVERFFDSANHTLIAVSTAVQEKQA